MDGRHDARYARLAELLVGRSLGVQPGWQVAIQATPLARPLVEELVRSLARRGAYPFVRLATVDLDPLPFASTWAAEAPAELLERLPPVEAAWRESIDARIILFSPENVADGSELEAGRRLALRRAVQPFQGRLGALPWVSCPAPTQALAQDAGLTLERYTEVLFDACLRDWDAESERMRRFADRFEAAEEVRVVGPGTDVTLVVAGRRWIVDDGHRNMPGGEIYTSPLEGSANGVVEFAEYTIDMNGNRCEGARLVFRDGVVVEATARVGEEFLLATLDTDDGARRLGEIGIGCNRGLPKNVRQVWFDEKVEGTVHLALGHGFPEAGGVNQSAIHWDLVKDLAHGRLELDGDVVQERGDWLI